MRLTNSAFWLLLVPVAFAFVDIRANRAVEQCPQRLRLDCTAQSQRGFVAILQLTGGFPGATDLLSSHDVL